MISPLIIDFLKQLTANNNREWFNANKDLYLQAKEEFEIFVDSFIPRLVEIDPEVGSFSAKECTFRIYKDVRFSKDKLPYKNNMGAYLVKGGKKSPNAGYYLHIEPEGSFLAGGIHIPDSNVLKAIRTEIYENVEEFESIIQHPDHAKYFGPIEADALKTAPKGFPKDWPKIEYLRFKSYAFIHKLTEEQITSPDFSDHAAKVFSALKPFNQWANRIVNHIE